MKKEIITSLLIIVSGVIWGQEITLELFKDGFSQPLSLQHTNDDRLFVVEKGGKIKIINSDGTVNNLPFLDISSIISQGSEQGLLGMAFHPDYANNGYFYLNYTNISGDTKISRFSVDPNNPNLAKFDSQLPILGYEQPFQNHNGGNLAFGPDGYLYIASGDGGSGGDPNNNGQNINTFLGKLLKIDINNPSNGNNYGIPPDNPFVGNPNAKQEIFAFGLRNPWRFSFDTVENKVWIADVGQGNTEEINSSLLLDGGLNYGWRCYEGTEPYNTQGCPPQTEITMPIAQYHHTNGNCSITGGYVYRGSIYTDLMGFYFFADYCSGMIGTVDSSGTLSNLGNFSGNWVSFGEDQNKELYILDISGGNIFHIKGSETASTASLSVTPSLTIFPNPASSLITFKISKDNLNNIEIFDAVGKRIYFEENISKPEITITTTSWKPGIYIGKTSSENGSLNIKKIIVH